ncbi:MULTISPECIES: Na+/H+ antiporter NhaA [Alteromonadaceae]|uniref:Na+/H+ antiporter NhaA n=1 Tax=Alteromonadaceae TaxID=72275 RepID=UPI001C08A76A|nr:MULTISPECIES: Na+/H+ antiporter NhaA [Aliiglaciecola]MBU2877637.1 Na+/H+ antiporter NhaA [Aliiglaciecola lipolytica]MDO6713170.1 Na+/H+ antiporter NhaA [Aliiglaciecola sp. 2_MG-2023]MDO6754250.1 Na+/H+ antiporter NhaA [Aliiglaciecola sp. 1_MG-2023]
MLDRFLKKESAGGILLMCSAVLALLVANSPFSIIYDLLIEMPVVIQIGALEINKPLLLWINDGLMAVFFFMVGLELKREILEGGLSNPANIVLPASGAIGGMLVPAGIYAFFTWGNPVALAGWAIPAATDIAFAMGILALLGSRVPTSLKIFLVTLAIIDDIGAILIIAVFYSDNISTWPLIVAALCLVILTSMNRKNVQQIPSYILIGVVLWVAMLKSGVHATLAGVLLAFFIPMRDNNNPNLSPVKTLEHSLLPAVNFVILPVFAFANSGINIASISVDSVLHPVTFGIFLGLFVGKQVGVFGFSWLVIKLGLAKLPADQNFTQLYGCAILCGVGFTMSLFIGSLAFEQTGNNAFFDERLGILLGSIVSAVTGYLVLKKAIK